MGIRNSLLIFLISSTLFYAGCAGGKYYSLSSPQHHFATGMKLMERYNLDSVEREFVLARELNGDFAPAYVGLAMVYSARGDFDKALQELQKAREKSKTEEDAAAVAVGTIKVYTEIYAADKAKGEALSWLKVADEAYGKAGRHNSIDPALHFFMGRAYKTAGKYDEAEESFRQVKKLNGPYSSLASEELKFLSRMRSKKKN